MSFDIVQSVRDRIDCMRVRPLLQLWLDGELDVQRERVAAHLEACRRCGLAASTYRSLKERLGGLGLPADPVEVTRLETFIGALATQDGNGARAAGDSGLRTVMRQAVWRGTVLAEADRTLLVEGNRYFPPDAVRWEHLVDSPTTSWCWWKGRARYLSIAVDDEIVADAAWYYPRPWPFARRLRCHVAFGPPVELNDGHS